MNADELVELLDDPAAAEPWFHQLGLRDKSAAHAHLVSIANQRLTLDLLLVLCDQLALHLPTTGAPDLALATLDRYVQAAINPLSFGALLEQDHDVLPTLLQLFSASPMLGDLLVADPTAFDLVRMTEGQPTERELLIAELQGEIDSLQDRQDVLLSLYHFKRREVLRIAYGDIVQRQPVAVVGQQLAYLADAICISALSYLRRRLQAKRGTPRTGTRQAARYCMLGLTRLGGVELDYEPHIRGLCIYESAGRTDGERPIDNQEFFDRLTQQLVELLATGPDGAAIYQLDIDKTPARRVGRWALTSDQTLAHFDTRGRTWERQAMMKARPVAGDSSLGHELLDTLEPWVYRRYLSRADIGGIQATKRRLGRRTDRRGSAVLDVEGGVVDVEFAVQYLQLLNGGDQRELRVGNTLVAIANLERSGCITPEESAELADNYDWLRRTEHRLEIIQGPHSQSLPTDRQALRDLALRCGYEADVDDQLAEQFRQDYDTRIAANQQIIQRWLADTSDSDAEPAEPATDLVMDPNPRAAQIEQTLAPYGFHDPADAYHHLTELGTERIPFLSARRCRHFLSLIAPQLLHHIAGTPSPDATLANLSRVSESLGGKGVLWQLLHSSPASLDMYVRLCAASPYLTSILTRYPGMIDELLDSLMRMHLPPAEELRATLSHLCHRADHPEAVLHSFKNTQHLSIGVRELIGNADTAATHAALTDVAEACLEQVIDQQYQRLVRKLGQPQLGMAPAVSTDASMDEPPQQSQPDGNPWRRDAACPMAVMAIGKLGGREPNYHSSVGLLFLFAADGSTAHPPTIRGRETTTNQHFFSELGHRVVKAAHERGADGRLYEMESCFRPLSPTGPHAASIDSFREYYQTGEHPFARIRQLCRVRAIHGAPDVLADAEAAIDEVLSGCEIAGLDSASVRQLRQEIQQSAGPRNLKRGPGGTEDVEILVQTLLLRNREILPARVGNVTTALQRLADHGILETGDAQQLAEHYQFLRRVESQLRLMNTTARHDLPREPSELAKLTYLMGFERSDGLESSCARATRQTRRLFEQLLA